MTTFKFTTKSDGITRRVTFPDGSPSWDELARRIEALYHIPVQHIGASYVDGDGDEVTLSTEEELSDYYSYHTSVEQDNVIRFTIQDLSSLRRRSSTDTDAALEGGGANLFNPFLDPPQTTRDSGDAFMAFDAPHTGEWAGLDFFANMGRPRRGSDASRLSAFVEVLDSDATSVPGSGRRGGGLVSVEGTAEGSDTPSASGAVLDLPVFSSEEKGKAKAAASHGSSTASLIAEEEPEKIPVHVMDVSRDAAAAPEATSLHPETAAEMFVDDPPLAQLDDVHTHASPSLTVDVANLLNSLMVAVSSHPELSEGLRNVVRNAVNGSYWTVQRQAMNQAAEDIARATRSINDPHVAEAEAGRRVTEVIGNVFRVLAETTGTVRDATAPSNSTTEDNATNITAPPVAPSTERQATVNRGPTHSEWLARRMSERSMRPWYQMHNGPQTPPLPPPPPMRGMVPPPPPPPAPMGFGGPLPIPPPFLPLHPPSQYLPPPPHVPQHWPHIPTPPFSRLSWNDWARGPGGLGGPHTGPHYPLHHHRSFGGQPSVPPRHEVPSATGVNRVDADVNIANNLTERKAQLEAAKEHYKAEKEKWRREREERRKERTDIEERRKRSARVDDEAPVDPVHPSSPFVGEHPRVDRHGSRDRIARHSINRQQGIQTSHSPRHQSRVDSASVPESPRDITQLGHRVTKRLDDMGFSEDAYPILSRILPDYLQPGGIPTTDTEDTIITKMLEQLLVVSPRPLPAQSMASGSNIPGSWL